MKKNASGQKIGAQLVSATDGSAFTSAVTVLVTGDAGTQATGSVGAGACAHEGNGYHTYAPAQAETNYDLIAFTFTGSGAIPATVQVYTTFPQTGDAFTRVLAKTTDITGFNDLSAAQVNAEADTALSDVGVTTTITGRIDVAVSTRLATAGYTTPLDAAGTRTAVGLASANLDTQLDALPTNTELATALGTADDAVLAAIAALNNLSQANIRTAVGLGSANLDTQLDALPTNSELATALAAADDAVLAAIAALNNLSQANIRTAVGLGSANLDTQLDALPTAAENADAVWDEATSGHVSSATYGDKLGAHLPAVLKALLTSGSTTTAVALNATTGLDGAAPSSVNDFYNGRVLIFTSGALAGQATSISDYDGATKVLTVVALTGAPASGVTAVIV